LLFKQVGQTATGKIFHGKGEAFLRFYQFVNAYKVRVLKRPTENKFASPPGAGLGRIGFAIEFYSNRLV
jgi:hypothetical protein